MKFKEFQEFRKILCLCPNGEIHRLSELKIFAKGKAPHTWMDEYEKKSRKLDLQEYGFEEKEQKLRDKAKEAGRKEAESAVNKLISPTLRKLKLNPYDIKAVLNPIDFIVFKDMNKKEQVSDIILLSNKTKNSNLNILRKQVKNAVSSKSYEWQVVRIKEEGTIEFE